MAEDMEEIVIQHPSQKVFSKLKNGHKVRLVPLHHEKHGEGVSLCVHKHRLPDIMKAIHKGKGMHMALTPEEIHHNHGMGIFGKIGDRFLRKIGRITGIGGDRFKDFAYAVGDKVKPLAKDLLNKGIDAGVVALSAYQPELAPFLAVGGNQLKKVGSSYLDNPSKFGVGERGRKQPPSRSAGISDIHTGFSPALMSLNAYTGDNAGYLSRANYENFLNNVDLGTLQNLVQEKQSVTPIAPYQFKALSGQGVAHKHLEEIHEAQKHGRIRHRHMHRAYEKSSIGIHGNLLSHGKGLPPALMSQSNSANFQFASRFPPAYQEQIKRNVGSGLYA